jgi:hypothetical protein
MDGKKNILKINHKLVYIYLLLLTVSFFSCGDKLEHKPLYSDSGKPKTISNIEVENINGGAVITYSLPNNKDIEYVHAIIEKDGKFVKEYMSSVFKDNIVIEGLPDTLEYDVKLRLLNCAKKASEDKVIKIKPQLPVVDMVYNDIKLEPDFGGFRFSWKNKSKYDLSMFSYIRDTLGELQVHTIKKVKPTDLEFSVDGLDTVNTVCGIKFKDAWGNFSKLYVDSCVPIFEEKIDGSDWEIVYLESDNYKGDNNDIKKLTDGKETDQSHRINPNCDEKKGVGIFTWDAKELIKVSKIRVFIKTQSFAWTYNGYNMNKFELYGSTTPSENWDDWDDLTPGMIPELIKPSGKPVGQQTSADIERAKKGFDFKTDVKNLGHYRYFRFKALSTFGNEYGRFSITGLYLFGQKK